MRLTLSATNLLLGSLVVAFFAQFARPGAYQDWIMDHFALSPQGLLHGYVWQLLTFQFLHAGIGHLVGNAVTLWSFGRYVEERLGKPRFLTLYLVSGVAGGLLQCLMGLLMPRLFGGNTIGASAGIFGVTAAFATLEPEATIMLFMLLPMRAKNLLYLSIAMSLLLPFIPQGAGLANAAHLGGIFFGVFYIRKGIQWTRGWADGNPWQRRLRREELLRAASPKPFKSRRPKPPETTELPPKEFISQEVDPILDKISAHGIQSLTERERQILQAARSRMSKR